MLLGGGQVVVNAEFLVAKPRLSEGSAVSLCRRHGWRSFWPPLTDNFARCNLLRLCHVWLAPEHAQVGEMVRGAESRWKISVQKKEMRVEEAGDWFVSG